MLDNAPNFKYNTILHHYNGAICPLQFFALRF